MYAIVDIAGQQLKVEKNQKVYVHRLDAEEGSKVDFDKVLLVDNDGKIDVGAPIVKDMVVSATVVSHLKGDKVKVFKKKRRKGYQVLNGHRQYLTEILIDDIAAGKAKNVIPAEKSQKKTAPKTDEVKVEDKAKAEKEEPKQAKPATKASTEKEEKKPVAKKTTDTKPAAKKAADAPKTKVAAKKAEPKKDDSEE